jgi:RNA polymerase sigma factor (sigma-70 family)
MILQDRPAPGEPSSPNPGPPSPAFSKACAGAGVEPHVIARLWALHSRTKRDGSPAWSADELLEDHAHWRCWVRTRAGDRDAAHEFHERWTKEARAYAASRFGRDGSDELVSEFFTRVQRLVGPDFAWTSPFVAYLRTILVNLGRDLRAREARSDARDESLEERAEVSGWQPRSAQPGPEQAAISAQESAAVRAALDELAPTDRFIVHACLVDGLSGHEVAEILGIDRDAAYQRLHRARARLKKSLASSGVLRSGKKKGAGR